MDNKIIISRYKTVKDNVGTDISIVDFIKGIRDGQWQDEVLSVRNAKTKEEKDKLKKKLEAVTISGYFEKRAVSGLRHHSGFLAMDIDNIDNPNVIKKQIEKDPYIYAAFISVSGKGVCLLFRINGDRHEDSFYAIDSYLYNTYGLISDKSCVDVSRLRIVSYDPFIHINEDAQVFKKYLPKAKITKKQPPKVVFVNSDFDQIVKSIYDRGLNLTEDYSDWLRVCYAIVSEYGDSNIGREYFDILSRNSSKYNPEDCRRQYDACLRTHNERKAKTSTINFIYWLAKQNGIETYSIETKDVIRAASSQHQNGVSKDDIAKSLEKYSNIPREFSEPIIDQVIEKDIKHESENIIEDIIYFLQPYGLKKNLITRNVEMNGRPIDDSDINTLFIDCKSVFDKATKDLVCSVIFSNKTEQYNPIRDFFESVPKRQPDHTPNLDKLIESIITDTKNHGKWITKWLVSVVASAYGNYSPLVLVLCGERQGTGKCLAKDTPVLMSDGSIKMSQNIKVGDKLMGPDGTCRNVLSIGRGRETMYRVYQNKGMEYVVNESHILSLKNRDTHETVNVNVKDYYEGKVKNKGRLVGYRGEIINNVNSNLMVDPYFLGLWLGDGGSDLKLGVRIETCDKEIVQYLEDYSKSINHFLSVYEQKKSRSNSYAFVKSIGSGNGVKNNKKHIKNILFSMNLNNNKHIPKEYLFSSREQRLQLLAGLIDSDGSISGACNYEITQKNKKLSDDICFLCRSLGFRATMKERKVNNVIYYRIHIGGNLSLIPVKIERKKITKKNFYNVKYTGIKVEKLAEDEYYGFEIDGDNLFMLADFTVTHNTHFFRYLLPKQLRYLFGESKMDNGKDDEILMTKKLIILDDEYGGKSKREEKKLKEITAKEFINVREPYGRVSVDLRRLAVFAGTSNDTQIISDPTGNRRIIPIHILDIDQEKYNECNKEELWHELYALYQSGYDYTVLREEIQQLNENTEMFNASTPEEELILTKLQIPKSEFTGEWMTATEVIKYLTIDTKYVFSNVRIGMLLTKHGFVKKKIKRNGNSFMAYWVEKVTDFNQNTNDPAPF